MHVLRVIALVLLILGGLNWGLLGLLNVDLVALLFGAGSALTRLVYILFGIAAIVSVAPLIDEASGDHMHHHPA